MTFMKPSETGRRRLRGVLTRKTVVSARNPRQNVVLLRRIFRFKRRRVGFKRRRVESKRRRVESKRRRLESKRRRLESKRRRVEFKRRRVESSLRLFRQGRLLFPSGATPCPVSESVLLRRGYARAASGGSGGCVVRGARHDAYETAGGCQPTTPPNTQFRR
jgi:hypothetical protein